MCKTLYYIYFKNCVLFQILFYDFFSPSFVKRRKIKQIKTFQNINFKNIIFSILKRISFILRMLFKNI